MTSVTNPVTPAWFDSFKDKTVSGAGRMLTYQRSETTIEPTPHPLWIGKEVMVSTVGPLESSIPVTELVNYFLTEIHTRHIRAVIFDFSDVETASETNAAEFIRMVKICHLLGTHVVIAHLSPSCAQTLVGHGLDLGLIEAAPDLQIGIHEALAFLKN
jgi:rsbT co-antagonist protein RsbR